MKTRDIDIRKSLHKDLSCEFKEDPETLIIDELSLCQGDARIDIAVVNGSMHGYEIKSESDTLERLPNQINIYSKIFDSITIITGECYIEKIINLAPDWWGIKQAEQTSESELKLIDIREPKSNPKVDPFSLVQLLWRDEALNLLKSMDLAKGYLSKSRRDIWNKLAESITINELQFHVRQQLKTRKRWRSD